MATVIDQLVVELGLDPKKFEEGQRKAVGYLRQLEQAADKHVQPVKNQANELSQAFTVLQGRLLSIAALFTGGLGIAEFTQHITRLTAEVGRLSQNFLDISPQRLAAWQGVGATVGASPGAVAGGLQAIENAKQSFRTFGTSPLFAMMGQVGLPYSHRKDAQGRAIIDSQEEIALTLSRYLASAKNGDERANRSFLLQQRGIPAEMINLLALGPEELQKRLAEFKKYAPTDEEISKFQALQEAFAKLTTAAEALGRAAVAANAEKLKAVLDAITAFLDKINGSNAVNLPATPQGAETWARAAHGQVGNEGGFLGAMRRGAGRAWDYTKRLFGGGGGEATTFNDRFGALGTEGSGAGQSASLRAMRQPYADQINADPSLRMRVAGMLQSEGSPQASMESMLNRLAYINQDRQARGLKPMTVDEMLHSGFYGPINRGELPSAIAALNRDPRRLQEIQDAMDRALGGSHAIGGRTDQGLPTDPNGMWPGGRMRLGGNVFNDWGGGPGGHAGAQRFRESIDARLAQEQAAPSPGFTGFAASLLSRKASAAGPTFDMRWNDRIGARGALAGGNRTTNNTNTSSTHIGEMNVTVPPGADPDAYARGIREKLMNYGNVAHANSGQF